MTSFTMKLKPSDNFTSVLSQYLRHTRKRLNMTQKQVAEAANVQTQWYRKLELGKPSGPVLGLLRVLSVVSHPEAKALLKEQTDSQTS